MTDVMKINKPALVGWAIKLAVVLVIVAALASIISRSIFYAEPGYVYHVRTLMGNEEVVTDVGYHFYI